MGVEVKPFGVKCNIQCQYCYQNPIRDAGNLPHSYDLNKMWFAIEAEGTHFGLFGGEALLMPKPDLQTLWAWGFERFGRNSVQTNGALIDDDHIRLFKQYRVHVGLSLDGPGELNDARWCGSLEKTRQTTAKVEAVIDRLCQEGLTPSIIITLTRVNASADKLDRLSEWISSLDRKRIRNVRLHILESENALIRSRYGLNAEENIHALLGLAELEKTLRHLRFDLFADMRNLLQGQEDKATCIWTGCDPYTTHAVTGIEGDGQRTNCGRTNKDGVDYAKSSTAGFERYLALYYTPQEAGGCRDCRFFLMCRGQCPGTALDGDWRNRSEHCQVWMALYAHFEKELRESGVEPLSLSSRRRTLEEAFIAEWARGQSPSLTRLIAGPHTAANPCATKPGASSSWPT